MYTQWFFIAVPNLNELSTFTLSCYNAEVFPILEHCCCVPCFIIWLRDSHTWNIPDLYPVSLQGWDIPNLETMLLYTLSNFKSEKFPFLKPCWIAPILKTLLMFTLSRYNAEPFPILKQGCCIPCLFLNLKYFLSWNIAELYPVSIHCSDVPILETLLTKLCHIRLLSLPYLITLLKLILTRYIDGLFPILIFFLMYSLSYYIAEHFSILVQCWCIPCLFTLLRRCPS